MTEFEHYKFLLGETIMMYQLIENDLKMIYAGMLKGDFTTNFEKTNNMFHGLTQIINKLQGLDQSDNKPYFTKGDYKLLKDLAKKRNYFCHQCCLDFAYNTNFQNSKVFHNSYNELQQVNKKITGIQKQTEDFRLDILKKFNRI